MIGTRASRWLFVALLAFAGCADDGGGSGDADTTSETTADVTTTPDGPDGVDTVDTTVADTTPGDTVAPLPGAGIAWPGWDSGTVYFVIVDRFLDGDPSNNEAYGREPDGAGEVATFHGGDWAGLRRKIEEGYFLALGVTALWITAPYEQIHGWVAAGAHKHWAYHGYYPLDFTRTDQAFGSDEDLGALVEAAHAQGIRVVLDVVMNHAGYATTADLSAYGVDVLKPGWEDATPANLYDLIDYESPSFANWWGPNWVRAEIGGGYPAPDATDLEQTVSYLPDFLTESTATNIGLPPFFARKTDTRAVHRPDKTVRGHLIEWLVTWVRTYGIDGFRCDTVKHVEMPAWKELKQAADAALAAWRADNPDEAFPASDYQDPTRPFWMTGEVYPHGVAKDAYFDNGFDSLINFDFQDIAAGALEDLAAIDATWSEYAQKLNADEGFDVLSYLSSHDTSLFFERYAGRDLEKQKRAGTLLLLTPGGVQIFYGDENARGYGSVSDADHRTRTDYQWGQNAAVLAHWQKLGLFRKRHPAVGSGEHRKIGVGPYVFSRKKGADIVYVALGVASSVTLPVGADFADGTTLRDAYGGATAVVSGGSVTFTADASGVVLVERP